MRRPTEHIILLGSKIKDALVRLNELNLSGDAVARGLAAVGHRCGGLPGGGAFLVAARRFEERRSDVTSRAEACGSSHGDAGG